MFGTSRITPPQRLNPDSGVLNEVIAGCHQFHAVNAAVEETLRASGMRENKVLGEDEGGYRHAHLAAFDPAAHHHPLATHPFGLGLTLRPPAALYRKVAQVTAIVVDRDFALCFCLVSLAPLQRGGFALRKISRSPADVTPLFIACAFRSAFVPVNLICNPSPKKEFRIFSGLGPYLSHVPFYNWAHEYIRSHYS